MLRHCADIKKLAHVRASLFFPVPKVDSVVVEIKFKETNAFPAGGDSFFYSVIKAAFSKRRKTLKNALAGSELKIEAERAGECLEASNIDPARRAETLTVQEFVTLSTRLFEALK